MVKTNVRVVARTRPTDAFSPNVKILEDGKTFHLHSSKKGATEFVNNTNADHLFKLDAVLKDASQEAVYEFAAADVVKTTMSGFHGTIMCYGQTGAGKTFTLMGGSDYRTRGCVPRCVKAVFDETQAQADKSFEIAVSFVEIYNDKIRDLLNPNGEEDYQVLEDAKGNVTIRGVEHRVCQKESEALALLFEGNTNRQTSDHSLNANSSRSHVIFTIHVTSRSRVESESAAVVSKLNCIDLAGSERLSKTGSEGKTAKEAQYINKSLTFLEQVVMALGAPNRGHVPFRQSKLTSLLKDSLGGNSRTVMIANLWPEERNFEETISTLKFAVRMMRVQTDPQRNTIVDSATQMKLLQRTITELKAELQMQNQLAGKSHVTYEGEFGEDERFEMEKTTKAFVSGTLQTIPVKSLREVREYFRILKGMIEQRDAELRSGGSFATAGGMASRGATAPTAAAAATGAIPAPPGVGAVDKASGFSVGAAAPSGALKAVLKAQPPTAAGGGGREGSVAAGGGGYHSMERSGPLSHAGGGEGAADRSNMSQAGGGGGAAADVPDKNTAFLDFKRGPAAKLAKFVKDTQETLVARKKRITELGHAINGIKAQIDANSAELQRMRNERLARGDDDVVDDHEFQLVQIVKEAKGEYRRLYDELTAAKDERDVASRSVDAAKRRMVDDFELWYRQQCELLGVSSSKSPNGSPHKGSSSRYAQIDDDLDEGERFEALELNKVLDDDPESVAFYTAKKLAGSRHAASRASPPHQRGPK